MLLWGSSGLAQFQAGQGLMVLIGLLLLFLAIRKGFEPLLLVPIGFGGILLAAYEHAGLPAQVAAQKIAGQAGFSNGMLYSFYTVAIASGVAPLASAGASLLRTYAWTAARESP